MGDNTVRRDFVKRKILIITPFLAQGGVEHSLVTALSGIDYDSYDVTLYLYKDDMSLLKDIPGAVKIIKGFDKTHYYRRPLSILLLAASKLADTFHFNKAGRRTAEILSERIHKKKVRFPQKKFFKNSVFDVVVSYCLHIGTEMALKIKSEKHYLFLHNSHTEYHLDIFESCYQYYDAFFAVSQGVNDVYSSAFPDITAKMHLISNYVDAENIIRKAEEYPIEEDNHDRRTILCTCGRLASEKGFDLAVSAASLLKKSNIPFVWFFVGDGYYRQTIDSLIEKENIVDQIRITGFKDNPYPYFASSDIYVQPSYEESQGLAIYEALLLGKPVVSTDTVGGRCTLENGKYGLLTDFTGESIADAIKLLAEKKELMSSFNLAEVIGRNLEEKQIYQALWRKLLNCEY